MIETLQKVLTDLMNLQHKIDKDLVLRVNYYNEVNKLSDKVAGMIQAERNK